jgi:RND family efflux transporter MFP subunit
MLQCTRFAFVAILVILQVFLASTVTAKETVTLTGLSEPVNDVILSFEVEGKIATIFFREGDEVLIDDPLILLNNHLEELEVERNELIWESKIEVESAEVREKTLKALFDSTLELFQATGAVSKDEVEKLELEYKLAAAEHQRLRIAEKREKIEYKIAKAKRDKRILLSPINGVVSQLFLDEGESCEPRQPVVRIVNISRCLLVCNVEASLGLNFKEGQKVDIRIAAGSGKIKTKGSIIFVSPVVDPASGLFQVKAEFDNANRKIKPGVEGYMIIPQKK